VITLQMKNDARFWVKETLERFNCESLDVVIQFNKRFTARMGDAMYGFPGPRIRLSEPMWPMISQAERRDTVIHEACHIVVMHEDEEAGRTGKMKSKPHGLEWRQKMRACGLEPRRVGGESIDKTKIPGGRKRYKVFCRCKSYPVTKRRFNDIVSGARVFRCRKCKAKLGLLTEPEAVVRAAAERSTLISNLAKRLVDKLGEETI